MEPVEPRMAMFFFGEDVGVNKDCFLLMIRAVRLHAV